MTIDRDALHAEMTAWRRDLHAHPEFGFEEARTAAFVAQKLREFGLDEVVEGIGGTGVVGTLRRGQGNRTIALRADMDALRITEQGERPHRSRNPGVMHACGHDGHTAMLSAPQKSWRRKVASTVPCASSFNRRRNGAKARWPCSMMG